MLYTLATAGPKALQFLTLPVFTRAMPPSEFGRLALVVAVTAAVLPLLTRGVDTAAFRGWYRFKDSPAEQRQYATTCAVFFVVVPAVVAVAAFLLSLPFTLGSSTLPADYLALGLAGSAVLLSATAVPLALLRAQERVRAYVAVSLVMPLISLPLSLLAVVSAGLGAQGWLAANLVGAVATVPVSAFVLRKQWSRNVSRAYLRELIHWAIPFIPHGLSNWALVSSDRFILVRFVPVSQVGVYNVGYQIGTVMGIFLTAINSVVQPAYGRAVGDQDALERLPRVGTYLMMATTVLALGLALLGPPVIHLVLPPEFSEAAGVVPWIALGYVFFALYLISMNLLTIVLGKVNYVWLPTLVAAVTSVVLNLALIPSGGIQAAAAVTAVSYVVLAAGNGLYARRGESVRLYEWRFLVPLLSSGACTFGLNAVLAPNEPVPTLLIGVTVLVAFTSTLGLLYRRMG